MTTPFYAQGAGTTPVGTIPVIPVKSNRPPNTTDITGVNGPFPLGQAWIDQSTGVPYILTQLMPSQNNIVATWVASGGTGGGLQTLTGDSGVAVPTLGNILIAGGAGISTSASGSTVTISSTQPSEASSFVTNIPGPVAPNASGEIFENASVTTFTDGTVANTIKTEVQSASGSILVGAGTNLASTALAASATAGIPIVSNSTTAVYGIASVAGGGTGDTSFTPYAVITGGTTSTGPLQNVVGVGTAGQVLTSNGAALLPTWQNEQGFTDIQVDAFTPPGTNPVTPSASNVITMTGGQVAAGTIGAMGLRTNSLAVNSLTIQAQRSAAVPTSNVAQNGISHFKSTDFSVDANGFVSLLKPGATAITTVTVQTFATSGTYTPTTGMKYCIVQCVGAGGGGGGANTNTNSSGGGGGAGGYGIQVFTAATIGASQAITIGTGGAAGTIAADGGTGGVTTFGALMTSNGGTGAVAVNSTPVIFNWPGGVGGTSSGGYLNSTGNPGEDSCYGVWTTLGPANGSFAKPGLGAAGPFGGGGNNGFGSNGGNATGPGSGGGGASSGGLATAFIGGTGANGIIIITEFS